MAEGRQVRFGGMNVLYDDEGNKYPVDDFGQLYVPLRYEHADIEEGPAEKEKSTKPKEVSCQCGCY